MIRVEGMMQVEKEIVMTAYNDDWPGEYNREAARLARGGIPGLHALHHIGSTSIPGMAAQPVIDTLAEVDDRDAAAAAFMASGYDVFATRSDNDCQYYIKKDRSENRRIHIYLAVTESEAVIRYLAFRDYLKTHNDAARFYSDLKCQLAEQFSTDRESYQVGKNEACRRITLLALQWWYDE